MEKELTWLEKLYKKYTHKHEWETRSRKATFIETQPYIENKIEIKGVIELKTCACGEESAYFIPLTEPPRRVNVAYAKLYSFNDEDENNGNEKE